MTKDLKQGLGLLALAAALGLLWLALRSGDEDFAQVAEVTSGAAILFGIGAAILIAVALFKSDD